MRRGKCPAPRFAGGVARRPWLLALALASPAYAQFDSGQISGFVQDSQGGASPARPCAWSTRSPRWSAPTPPTTPGTTSAPALPPGKYQVVVELAGFRKYVKTGVTVDAAAKVSSGHRALPGGIEEAITVMAEATPLQINTGQVAKTIEASRSRT